ncbi:MAG: alcohol dehydrogenase catalytic domain-containing protein [Acidobacteriota bacterium]
MPLAATLVSPGRIELADRQALVPLTGEVIVRVATAGICGTDLALHSGDYAVPLPLVLGHEVIGTVVRKGDGVPDRWLGRRVAVEINNTCVAYGRPTLCRACHIGIPSHCQSRTVTGIIAHDGGWAEEMRAPAGALHEVPDALDTLAATLCEPLAAAIQTFEVTPLPDPAPETVVVVGPGRLGILVTFVAAERGARVLAVSRSARRRARAMAFGAVQAFDPSVAGDAVRDLTGGLGADIVVDTTGAPEGLGFALSLVRPRGVLAAKTTCGLPSQGIPMTRVVVDEVRIQGSRCGPFGPALGLLARHADRLAPLITSVRPLAEIQGAVASAMIEDKVVLRAS